MDTRQLEYILAIDQEKNITKAAQKLYISQPTLSQSLLKLEQELGQSLFIRLHNEMIPTAAGRDYIDTAKQVIKLKKRLYQRLSLNTKKVYFSLGVSSRWGIDMLARVLPRFQKRSQPVTFNITDGIPSQLIKRVSDGTLDMAVITAKHPSDFPNAELLYQEELVLAVPESWCSSLIKESFHAAEVLSQFISLPFILAPGGTSLRSSVDEFFLTNSLTPEVTCEMNNMTGALHLTNQEIGFSFIPASRREVELSVRYFSAAPALYRYHMIIFRKELGEEMLCRELVRYMKEAAGAFLDEC